jgi:DNA-binding CsgD family transcriptional regulator
VVNVLRAQDDSVAGVRNSRGAGVSLTVSSQSVLHRIALETCLMVHGCFILPEAPVTLLLDTPMLNALLTLEGGLDSTVVVVTENRCHEYWLDLLAFNPAALLVSPTTVDEVVSALVTVVNGKCVYPKATSPLWPQERRVLRLLAAAYEPEVIASTLGIKGAVVRNYISSILLKLRLTHPNLDFYGRSQLVSYYQGSHVKFMFSELNS